LAARIYHAFKPVERVEPVVFEGRGKDTVAAVR
jgi:hypothetical protein